jgi:hypothetical protein
MTSMTKLNKGDLKMKTAGTNEIADLFRRAKLALVVAANLTQAACVVVPGPNEAVAVPVVVTPAPYYPYAYNPYAFYGYGNRFGFNGGVRAWGCWTCRR